MFATIIQLEGLLEMSENFRGSWRASEAAGKRFRGSWEGLIGSPHYDFVHGWLEDS